MHLVFKPYLVGLALIALVKRGDECRGYPRAVASEPQGERGGEQPVGWATQHFWVSF
jgi:hypothetical protein